MLMPEEEFAAFEGYVRSDAHTERECQRYLPYANEILLPNTTTSHESISEEPHYFGRTDFIVFGNFRDDVGTIKRFAYIWELKAPQCFLFERDDSQRRCRVTKDFIKGENQLLHYFHQAMNDDLFRQRSGLESRDCIRFGGIIIGTDEKKIDHRGDLSDVAKAEMALGLRMEYLYRANGIRIMTWDRILDFVRPTS